MSPPRDANGEIFLRHLCLSVVDLSLHDYAAAGHWGHTCEVRSEGSASQ